MKMAKFGVDFDDLLDSVDLSNNTYDIQRIYDFINQIVEKIKELELRVKTLEASLPKQNFS